MYVIIVYDVGEKRVGKMLKLCRQYLCWIQNSVLEGELSEAKLRELQMKMKAIKYPTLFDDRWHAPIAFGTSPEGGSKSLRR